jgi:hypothetical protein
VLAFVVILEGSSIDCLCRNSHCGCSTGHRHYCLLDTLAILNGLGEWQPQLKTLRDQKSEDDQQVPQAPVNGRARGYLKLLLIGSITLEAQTLHDAHLVFELHIKVDSQAIQIQHCDVFNLHANVMPES